MTSLRYKDIVRRVHSSIHRSMSDTIPDQATFLNSTPLVNFVVLQRNIERISKDITGTLPNVTPVCCPRCGSHDIYVGASFTIEVKLRYSINRSNVGSYRFVLDSYDSRLKLMCTECEKIFIFNWWNDVTDLFTRPGFHDVYTFADQDIVISNNFENTFREYLTNRNVYITMRLFPEEPSLSTEISSLIGMLEKLSKGGQK